MRQKRENASKQLQIFDVAAAVAERIKELDESQMEFMRRDAELNRMIDEAWKKSSTGKS